MRLCSILNVWADTLNLLDKCIENHLQFSHGVIVVWSSSSNHMRYSDKMLEFVTKRKSDPRVIFHQCEPVAALMPMENEIKKRNIGLSVAKDWKFTHFILADGDEFYLAHEVNQVKPLFDDINGTYCGLRVYVKTPTLWCEDRTKVAFIHRLKPETKAGMFKDYPGAYDKNGNAQIDPTRRINETSRVVEVPVTMHHFSYVRTDMELKIKNSSANLRRSTDNIRKEMENAAPGWVSLLYHKPLKHSDNIFNL